METTEARKTILACGSRHWTDERTIRITMLTAPTEQGWPNTTHITVIHGNCRGADQLAAQAARDLGHTVTAYPANWKLGKRAGPIRNQQMLNQNPDLILAFGDGRGTRHTITQARRRDIPVMWITDHIAPSAEVA